LIASWRTTTTVRELTLTDCRVRYSSVRDPTANEAFAGIVDVDEEAAPPVPVLIESFKRAMSAFAPGEAVITLLGPPRFHGGELNGASEAEFVGAGTFTFQSPPSSASARRGRSVARRKNRADRPERVYGNAIRQWK